MGYRDIVWGMDGDTRWEPLLPPSGLAGIDAKGPWIRRGDLVKCEAGDEGAHMTFGEHDWRDYEVRTRLVVETGGNAQIAFRLNEEGTRGYLLDLLLGWQAVGVSRFDRRLKAPAEKLSVVNHELRRGRGYEVELAVRGHSITSYVNGHLVNQVTAFDHERGRFAFLVWQARITFDDSMFRRLA